MHLRVGLLISSQQQERASDASGAGARSSVPSRDWHVLIPLILLLPIIVSTAAISDVDSYWHVLVGEELLETQTATGLGDSWAWYSPSMPWTTSQWLSEAMMALLVKAGGWNALVYATTAAAIALVAAIVWVVLRRASGPRAVLLIGLAALPLVQWINVRPAMLSLVATVMVAHVADRTLTTGCLPRWWSLPLIALWANLHGQWVIAPAAIGVAGVLYWLADRHRRYSSLRRTVLFVVAMVLAGCLTPLGFRSLTLAFTLRDTTSHLDEWQPVYFMSWEFLPLALVGGVLVWRWTRQASRPSTHEVAYALVWAAFGMTAERNALVAALLLLPLAARALDRPSAHEARHDVSSFGRLGLVGTFAVVAVLTAVSLTRVEGLSAATPLAIAQRLSTDYDSVRVLNQYNSAGVLAAFGPPGIQLGIDGRAERYGREYIDRYLDVFALRGDDWAPFLIEFQPEAAVVERGDPIGHVLINDWGWEITLEDPPYLLLAPDGDRDP